MSFNENLLAGICIIGVMLFSIFATSYLLNEIKEIEEKRSAELRTYSTPTSYEYDVLSVSYHEADLWDNDHYKIIYQESNGTVTRFKIDEDKLQVIYSLNNSKLIIENPELNGYPDKYILYWDFQELT